MKLQDPEYSLCAPVTLYNILSIYMDVELRDLVEVCNTHAVRGTTTEGIINGLDAYGFKLERLRFSMEGVRAATAHGHIIATYRVDDNENHLTWVTGVETRRRIEYINLADPLYGHTTFPMTIFRMLWRLEGSWARLVVPK